MTSQYIDRREAARRVRTSLGVALAECGMKTPRGGKGWVRRFPESGNGVGVWIQFANASRAFGLPLSKEAGAVTCVRAEVGVGPVGWEMYSYAALVNTTELVPPNMEPRQRSEVRSRAGQVVERLVADSDPAARDASWFAEMRLDGDDSFFPLADLAAVDFWCERSGPILSRLVNDAFRRSL